MEGGSGMKKARGSMTVEATIVLPFYILLLLFLANFMNIYYLHQAVQYGLNNAGSVLAQYCYAVDQTIGMDKFSVSEQTQGKFSDIGSAMESFNSATQKAMSTFDDGITIDKLDELISNGKNFASATTNLANKLKAVKGDDLVSYLLTTAGETGGGMIVESMVEDYLDQMKVNRNLLSGDIQYALYIDNSTNDLILKAAYCYNDPMFSIFTEGFAIEQQVVVHPWIGGKTPGLRGKLVG